MPSDHPDSSRGVGANVVLEPIMGKWSIADASDAFRRQVYGRIEKFAASKGRALESISLRINRVGRRFEFHGEDAPKPIDAETIVVRHQTFTFITKINGKELPVAVAIAEAEPEPAEAPQDGPAFNYTLIDEVAEAPQEAERELRMLLFFLAKRRAAGMQLRDDAPPNESNIGFVPNLVELIHAALGPKTPAKDIQAGPFMTERADRPIALSMILDAISNGQIGKMKLGARTVDIQLELCDLCIAIRKGDFDTRGKGTRPEGASPTTGENTGAFLKSITKSIDPLAIKQKLADELSAAANAAAPGVAAGQPVKISADRAISLMTSDRGIDRAAGVVMLGDILGTSSKNDSSDMDGRASSILGAGLASAFVSESGEPAVRQFGPEQARDRALVQRALQHLPNDQRRALESRLRRQLDSLHDGL